MRALVLILLLAACGRPLTGPERSFAAALFGDSLHPGPITITETPLVGLTERTFRVRPRTTCQQRILPPPEGETFTTRTAGIAAFETLLVRPGWYLDSYLPQDARPVSLVAAMFFAHEMTHIWQWQNRERTGYHPLRAAVEQRLPDPYLFELDEIPRFLGFGFEQQASIVEEYVCCRALDPGGDRTERLHALVSQELPLTDLPRSREYDLRLPWDDLDPTGICG